MDGALEEEKTAAKKTTKKTGHQRRPPQEPAAPYGRVLSAGQRGFINIDESLSASPLGVTVPRRVLFESPDGATETNVQRLGCEENKRI